MKPITIIKEFISNSKDKVINKHTDLNSNTSEISRRLIRIDGRVFEEYDQSCLDFDMDRSCITIEDDKDCAITSKPIIKGQERIYFTKDGFKGTMALDKETLLDADVYRPVNDEDDIDSDLKGQIEDLTGSKKKLHDMNEAKRAEKLLEPQSIDKSQMLSYIGAGVAIGFIIAQYMIGGA